VLETLYIYNCSFAESSFSCWQYHQQQLDLVTRRYVKHTQFVSTLRIIDGYQSKLLYIYEFLKFVAVYISNLLRVHSDYCPEYGYTTKILLGRRKKFVPTYTFKIYNKEIEYWNFDEDGNCRMQDVSSQLQLINSALHNLGRVFYTFVFNRFQRLLKSTERCSEKLNKI
jgi:hypothetical protein